MTTLFLAWQDPNSRRWFTIGRLDVDEAAPAERRYTFTYVGGARVAEAEAGFRALVAFPDLNRLYTSSEVFPLFANRMMPTSRPEYDSFVEWMSVPEHANDPVALLGRSGGRRRSDTLEVYAMPERREGRYRTHFFVHGLRHTSPDAIVRADSLESGERLLIMRDIQNPYDERALQLRTSERVAGDMYLEGYLPRYLADDLDAFDDTVLRRASVTVVRVNPPPAPQSYRLLCRLEVPYPEGHVPFSGETYQPLMTSAEPASEQPATPQVTSPRR